MQNTIYTVGFTDDTTIQIRFELGDIVDRAQTTDVPEGITADEEGFVYDNGWVGRQTGANGEYFQYYDDYSASAIDPVFDVDPTVALAEAPADDAGRWTVRVNGEEVALDGVSRKANILQTAETALYNFEFRTAQNVFLELDRPLAEGDTIEITFDDPAFETITSTFDPATTISEAVHVNLTGYDPDDAFKKAFLSSWNGWTVDANAEAGGVAVAQDYQPGMTFELINAETGQVVKTGDVTMAQAVTDPNNFWNNFQRTDVWEMDFSDVTAEGDYYVAVDGVGISQTFSIEESHWQDIFETSFSGFYHQRSGIALEQPYTDFVRPASLVPGDGLVVERSTLRITETSEGGGDGSPFERLVAQSTGETVDAWGGWHDAGDWDRRTQHLEAARNMIELMEITPGWGDDDTLAIPERGDGIPDILQEAMWGIEVFKRLQTDDGGISGGIEQEGYETFGGASWTEAPTIYAYAPDVWSSWEYAAAAAKVAHNLKHYDATLASEWLQSAQEAFSYAEANWQAELGGELSAVNLTSRNIAALELFRETGLSGYEDVFEATSVYASGDRAGILWNEHQYEAAFLYNLMGDAATNDTIRQTGLDDIAADVDLMLDVGARSGFGSLFNPWAPYGWGNTATQPNYSQDTFVRLHHLTGDADLLATIQGDVQYALGANPLNMTYLTGLDGVRGPEELLNLDAETLGYGPVPGITVYGDFSVHDYGWGFYHDVMYADQWPNVWHAPISESWQGFSIYVPVTEYTVQQGITDMSYVTGYLAALGGDAPADDPTVEDPPVEDPIEDQGVLGTDGDDLMRGTREDDTLSGLDGADDMRGSHGDDTLYGGNGDDALLGSWGADDLFGGDGDDRLAGGKDDDRMVGGMGNDLLIGSTGADTLEGGAGNDRLSGGSEDDVIVGGLGDDTLNGGDGSDLFVFAAGFGRDMVRGLTLSEDRLQIDAGLLGSAPTIASLLTETAEFSRSGRKVTIEFQTGDIVVLNSASVMTYSALEDALILG